MLVRKISEEERLLLLRFCDVEELTEREILAAQILSLNEVQVDSGYLRFNLPTNCEQLRDFSVFPLDGIYHDSDGALVNLILHVDFESGVISLLERFRPDGEPIVLEHPLPTDVVVGPNPLRTSKSASLNESLRWEEGS
jgi:hypothetical protein